MHKSLTSGMARRSYGPDCSPLGMNDPMSSSPVPNNNLMQTNLLQVRVVYTLTPVASSSSSGAPASLAGVVFRRPPPLAALFQATLGGKKEADRSESGKKAPVDTPPAVSVYSASFSSGSLRDVDGVRCWLPCLDALDQRAIYDISLTAPRNWRIACCGKKLSTYLLMDARTGAPPSPAEQRKVSRFFTPNRIAAMSVGWYMGAVELYKMPLYKVRARVWVSTGLNDFISPKKASRSGDQESDGDTSGDNAGSSDAEDDRAEAPYPRPLDSSYYADFKRRLPGDSAAGSTLDSAEPSMESAPPSKRMRTTEEGEGVPTSPKSTKFKSTTSAKKDKAEPAPSRLYESKVRHSTLGLDISLRLLHKFVGHRYDYDEFTFVYVHDLGCEFVSYDGFALVDAKYLHGELEVYMETTAHLVLLQAYLYSWLKSALPVSAYDAEFIVHGAVGYLLNFYTEEVYGEEDGRYRYQKMYDTVVALEKQGAGFPLASFFPERYDVFGLQFGVYLRCKSAVLFQLIENRVGGKEHMRISLKQLIRSPPVFTPVVKLYKGSSKDVVNNFQSLFDSNARGGMSPVLPNHTPPTPSMVSQALVLNEEHSRYRSYSEDGSYGGMSPYSPYNTGNRSPSTLGGNMSPATINSGNISPYPYNFSGNVSPYPYSMGNISPYPAGGNMSPYAPYASYHPTLGAATPMYDHYRSSVLNGAYQQTYSPNRYEITNSPMAPTLKDSDAVAPHMLVPVPSTHLETTSAAATTESAAELDPAAVCAAAALGPEVDTTTKVVVPVVDSSGPGFYAVMAQREQRIRSNSVTSNDGARAPERARSNSAAGNPASNTSPRPSSASKPALVRQESVGSATAEDRDWSVLASDCVSAESFILTVRHASGASADIDDGFLDKYVYKSGALFLRLHVNMSDKVENKPRQIFVTSQMVGTKEGGLIDDTAEKIDLKVRIAEARDDVVTEPMISFATKEDQYQQQAYTRPGRRGGKRRGPGRKNEDGADLDAQQLEAIAQRNREREARKSALLRVRDIDYPLRYVLLDPMCQQIVETYNASADVLLVEQLYTDYYENNVYFQCQALRSLARAGHSTAMITTDLSPEAAAFVSGAVNDGAQLNASFGLGAALNSSFGASGAPAPVKIPEKSANMQLKALCDCLLGVPTNVNDAKLIASHQFSIYVRAEAAQAMARWQNERAPRTTATDGTNSSAWPGLDLLLEQLHNMFADQDSDALDPLPSDFSNESSTHLRNTMILALSSIKSKSGHSPADVYQTIIKFARHNEESDLTFSPEGGSSAQYDDAHYRGVLFLALSRLRFEGLSTVDKSVHPALQIVAMASSAVNVAFTRARATARINFQRGDANFLPTLSGRGIDVAAAITCLAELDIQSAALYAKGRAQPVVPASATHSLRDVERNGPTGRGPLSGFNYVKHFLPSDTNLLCIENTGRRSRGSGKSKITFHLCTPAVRAAAFEGFVRLCFAMQSAHEERLRSFSAVNDEAVSSATHIKAATNTAYIPAVIEALSAVLKADTNLWVKQQAAMAFADVLMDRPARIAAQAVSLNNYWNCLEWSDPCALTLPQHLDPSAPGSSSLSFTLGAGGLGSSGGTTSNRRSMQHGGDPNYSQVALKLVWKLIHSSVSLDQVRQSHIFLCVLFCCLTCFLF